MEEGKTVSLPNVGVCLEKIKKYLEKTRTGEKASTEDVVKTEQALKYLEFLFKGEPEWNWDKCNVVINVIDA